jgi:antirestriction protein ArdC
MLHTETASAPSLDSEKIGKADVYSIVTDKIIEQMENGVVPWRRPWGTGTPKNLVSGKEYRGMNHLLLGMCSDFPSRYWLSFKQAKEQGGSVKKGEKGSIVVYWKWHDEQEIRKLEEKLGHTVARAHPFYARVFNLSQCEGIPAPADDVKTFSNSPIENAEAILNGMPNKPAIVETNAASAKAGYGPKTDTIYIPPIERFETPDGYYGTLFHELTHSTGHAKRLARAGIMEKNHFGSEEYGVEELVAELGSAFLCAQSGITSTVNNSAAYLNNWLQVLKNDRKMIVHASQQAQKAADYILNIQVGE